MQAVATSGKLLLPCPQAAAAAAGVGAAPQECGADLLTQGPEIVTWLKSLAPGKKLVLGCYVYLDGTG